MDTLSTLFPDLQKYLITTPGRQQSVDFSDPRAVKALNSAILLHHYGIQYWEFSDDHLCPAIPGRAEYIHHAADILKEDGEIPRGSQINCLDIGTGGTCIYPIIGVIEYGWSFIGSDISSLSLKSAQTILDNNPTLQDKIQLRHQENSKHIFQNVIRKNEKIDITISNPPFHGSREEAERGTRRKLRNLGKNKGGKQTLNFSGKSNELMYKGGEIGFISNMINESKTYATNIKWFTTLVSKEKHLTPLINNLKKQNPTKITTVDIEIGNKKSRILAWTYMDTNQRKSSNKKAQKS